MLLANQGDAQKAIHKTRFSFVHMADIHVQPDGQRKSASGFLKAIEVCNGLKPKPDFVINAGDLVMDVLGADRKRAVQLYDLYQKCCESYEMPVYHVIGNHDVFGCNEGGPGPDAPEYGKAMFIDRLGPRKDATYYSWDFGRWHFVALDTIAAIPEKGYEGGVDAEQLEWLAADLKAVGKRRPICLVVHIPLMSIWPWVEWDPLAAHGRETICVNAKDVIEVCKPYNLKLVLQGHQHIYECIRHHGIEYITGGAVCGAWWSGPYQGDQEGFVHFIVEGDQYRYRFVDYGWEV